MFVRKLCTNVRIRLMNDGLGVRIYNVRKCGLYESRCPKVEVRMYSTRSGQTRSRSFEHVHSSRPSMFYLSECFASLRVSRPTMSYLFTCFTPHVSRPIMFYFYVFHAFNMFHVPPCFTSLHVLNAFVFYLSASFTFHHVLSLCAFQIHSCVNSLCMFQVPPRFISL
jgi:hypothetical protein